MAFVNEPTEGRKWHTIDRKRGIVLECIKPGGSSAMFGFSLTIKNEEAIKFEALRNTETIYKKGLIVRWILHSIYVPVDSSYSTEEIKQLISEALDAFGLNSSRKLVLSVEVNTDTHSISRS